MKALFLTASLLALGACSTLDQAADTLTSWRLSPEAPPKAPLAKAPPASVGGLATVPEVAGARLWVLEPGSTARRTMSQWAAEAGYTLFWQAQVDRPIKAGASVYDTFENAVGRVFTSGFQGPPALVPIFKHGNRVLLVTQDGTLGQ